MSIFEKTKEVAKSKGWTLRQLEKEAGIGQNSLYRWKSYNPRAESLKKVADALGVSVSYLLGESNEPKTAVDNSVEGLKERLVSYDGMPVTDHDAKIIKQFLDAYYSGKEGD